MKRVFQLPQMRVESRLRRLIQEGESSEDRDQVRIEGAAVLNRDLRWNGSRLCAASLRAAPRPGHADLSGCLKYDRGDVRDILERASARETAARVAVGAVAKQQIEYVGLRIVSHVVNIGGVFASKRPGGMGKEEPGANGSIIGLFLTEHRRNL